MTSQGRIKNIAYLANPKQFKVQNRHFAKTENKVKNEIKFDRFLIYWNGYFQDQTFLSGNTLIFLLKKVFFCVSYYDSLHSSML